ncbi:MAG: ATP-binding protein [Candidatus Aminicenantes bacterium]|nr:ATP-binding protein [Candidatus Aminicenantes bacterium]
MITRFLKKRVQDIFNDHISILLLGPRQSGKTTFVNDLLKDVEHLSYNFMKSRERQRFERDPSLLIDEIAGGDKTFIFVDEVQKVPQILDNIQVLIDSEEKIFVITGSSARKLKRKDINLLPGRVAALRMDPLYWEEYSHLLSKNKQENIKNILKFGELPRIFTMVSAAKKKTAAELLYSYVNTYLEEEIRAEALVRNMGAFSKFLKLSAEESGRIISLRNLSQDVGVPHSTISVYYRILLDCLIAEKIEALVPASQRGKVVQSSKYLFFDTGIVNAASEVLGTGEYRSEYWGSLFEQWVGITILKLLKLSGIKAKLYYWRDYNGREVDWIIEYRGKWLPIEVKWADRVRHSAAKNIEYFLNRFPEKTGPGYVVFTGDNPTRISERVTTVPYFDLIDNVIKPFLL